MTRTFQALCAALLATVALLGVSVMPVHAAVTWVTRDDFDTAPETRWTEACAGPCNTAFTADDGRLGTRSGFVQSHWGGSWAGLGRTVDILAATPHCTASVYLSAWRRRGDGHLYVNIEVIDPATWQYLTLKQVDLWWDDHNESWTQFRTARFTASRVVFRVTVGGPTSSMATTAFDMDDLRFDCSSD